jgi:UTP--glucose-1-phosphate uridylyltransferase
MKGNNLMIENFKQKMLEKNYDERLISLFLKYYEKLKNGSRGIIYEKDILPVEYGSVVKFSQIKNDVNVRANDYEKHKCFNCVSPLRAKTAVIKLNGGLGTSMGMDFPKSFVEVRDKKRFIDIAAEQHKNLPLIFMNSLQTKEMTDKFIAENPQYSLKSFVQHSFPKVLKDSLGVAESKENSEFEYNPAGHGDVYMSLWISGILDELLADGFRFAFISNIDNTGAVFDASIANYMEKNDIPFLMEVCRRGEMDKKGGHIAKNKDGNFILREKAQAAEEEIAEFENIDKYSYFNTNSIWVDLRKLNEILQKNGVIELPFIANEKTLNPNDKSTPKVFQIEQAMGAAISLFDGAKLLEIEKERFFPVKTTNDLFLLRSDRFFLENSLLKSFDGNKSECNIVLNPKFYGNLSDFEKRVKDGVPKLQKCRKLVVNSDIYFNSEMIFEGEVEL